MGVNSERKKLERNISAFSKFIDIVKNPEKYILYIHCNIHASLGGPDLQEIILESGKGKQIIAMSNNASIPRNKIYEFYKVCDCYLGLSGGEGFGYGYVESFLHKKPVIYTKWGGHSEFANIGGIGIACRDYVYSSRMGAKWGLADLKDASLAMRDLVYDKERREKLGNAGYDWVKENIDWNIVFKKLLNCINKTFSKSTSIRFYGSKIRRII
jgi:glycosyltransferase involved in cell wall biosynthesis